MSIVLRGAVLLIAIVLLGAMAALTTRLNDQELDREVFVDRVRDQIERAEQVRDAVGPNYQADTLAQLPANPTVGPFFRLDDLLETARIVEAELTAASSERNEVAFGIEFDDGGEFRAEGETTGTVEAGTLLVEHVAGGYLRNAEPIAIPKDAVGSIEIRMRADRGKRLRLAWSKEPEPKKIWKNKVDTPIVADGAFHTYSINARTALRRGLVDGDVIRSLFLAVSDATEASAEVDYIRFLTRRSKYSAAPRGVAYESIGNDTRRVLYMLPAQTIEYSISVPEDQPRMAFGAGTISLEGELSFRVEVEHDGATQIVHESKRGNSETWNEEKISLDAWAGKAIRLRLGVRGASSAVGLWSSPIVYSRPPEPFRAIVLLEDTLRADHLSTYGYERTTSPFRDRLMRDEGMVLLYATSQATKTRPSVPSMMTSLLPSTTGVWSFADVLADEYLTLAEIMRSQGFATASFVQNGNAGPYAGLHQGFDIALDHELVGKRPDEILQSSIVWDWIERNRDRNFLLYLHLTDPHGPYDPPKADRHWYEQIAPGEDPQKFGPSLDANWVEQPTGTGRAALYDGEIRRNDRELEAFFARVRSEGLFEKTAFVMVSDHGEHFGEHGVYEHRPPGTLPVTRVPLLIVYPERFPGGGRFPDSVQLLDVTPTLLELAQVASDSIAMQGDSLVGLLDGSDPEGWRDRVTVSEEVNRRVHADPERDIGWNTKGSLFFRDWHFIASSDFSGLSSWLPPALGLRVYAFREDPLELRPLLRFMPDLELRKDYVALLGELQAVSREAGERFVSGDAEQTHQFDADVLDHLEELGYIE